MTEFSDEVKQINAQILSLQDKIKEQQQTAKLLQKNIKIMREAVFHLKEERRLTIVAAMLK